ncbi:uncharacterized protein BP5553_03779 [Venustampulla echinocandica]|uniref:Ams2/SPT21 N-terminal domain-containing protein n=1 Tax=Venustampulla echinocandica TaxID=2656787 RepID=A0A370TVA9_9HELO|nr:uncharacterized protein BP5553_03779 [Venustampulla echinocandica]RDL39439.1 hypothetical protein BP5553_03779 [Venustampulla echinocandica]
MSSPAALIQGPTPWSNPESQVSAMGTNTSSTDDGVSVRPMRLKVLYTFDDQNKTNCLARWPHVLQIQTVAMDETTSIGVIELKTCIQAIVQCSPELVARLGQDYTVYAYDFSEYDNPLVGQGMLSWALGAASSTPDSPAHQSNKLITGRVCKNILGLFANGVKETLEVKLRLVPVPTVLQSEYINAMEKYRELSRVIPAGLDPNEWTAFLQSNPNFAQLANKATPTPSIQPTQRDGTSMELVNQLLSPSVQEQSLPKPPNQGNTNENICRGSPAETTTTTENPKKASPPPSRAAVKRPRKGRPPKNATAQGGNTSGYEEGTDGDDGPPSKKRAKITKADWSSKSTIGSATDSLRVAASTAGSLRLFRPIAMSPMPTGGSHLQDMPRAPTPVPNMSNQYLTRPRTSSQSNFRADFFTGQADAPQRHISPYPPLQKPEDQPRFSIESANNSPERNDSPVDTPPGINSSPPVMRTRPPSPIRSSPPCPSSPVLPQMPRTDSGFMSASLEDLFGEGNDDGPHVGDNDRIEVNPEFNRHPAPQTAPFFDSGFRIEEETPGPMELLPTKIPVHKPKPAPSKRTLSRHRSRAGSVMSEDGQQTLPPLRRDSRATPSQLSLPQALPQSEPTLQHLPMPQSIAATGSQAQSPAPEPSESREHKAQASAGQVTPIHTTQSAPAPAPPTRYGSRMMARTASMGALTFPEVPASEPAMPPSSLQRSQTWSDVRPGTEEVFPHPHMRGMQPCQPMPDNSSEYSRACLEKKASIRQKLELAIANGQMPPFCSNCGAIETPTWRKAWSQDHQGAPGYHEYSDLPGRVTCINILARDSAGMPTSYQLIKKSLSPGEKKEEYKEFLLCNPCGIWMTKYKIQRPKEKWESYAPATRKGMDGGGNGGRAQRPSKAKNAQSANLMVPTSEANFPPSDAYFPPSEGYFPTQEVHQLQRGTTGPLEGVSPTDTTGQMRQLSDKQRQEQDERRRSTSSQPTKRLKAITSGAASTALKRAIQSSPARWAGTRTSPVDGTRQSPIDVEEDLGSTRRLLFPSPRKDGSPKILGEVMINVEHVATDFRPSKGGAVEATDKENCPPAIEAGDMDAELLKLFDQEMERPRTPTQKSPIPNPFKTPTRPTPSHRPITRSVSRSIRSAKSPGQLLSFGQQTPTKTPRRSPRNHDSIFESPFTATMNQLMSEANNQSPTRDALELDFGHPSELPNINVNDGDMNFNIEDFFSTDVPMPSSPPRMFHLYEDPTAMQNIDWNQFGRIGGQHKSNGVDGEVAIKPEPEDSPQKRGENTTGIGKA